MKREGHLFGRVADFHSLCAAVRRAARGKGSSHSAAEFVFGMEREVLKLQREILDGSYRPRPYRTFYISDPKPRTISAADFRDRVAHHSLCAVLEPLFERVAIFDSYACRLGKGSHAAARRAQAFGRRFGRFLKLDIRKFFETADHEVLKIGLRRLVKDAKLLELTSRIIDHGAPGSAPGKGLPIGNLTSQHFANFYLASLDHFIKEKLRVPGYLRYMDDFLLFADSKRFLSEGRQSIQEFVGNDLKLSIKSEATVHAPVSEGIPFLGLRIWPRLVRLDGSNKRRLISALRAGTKSLTSGELEEDLVSSLRSRLGHAEHADTLNFRRSLGELCESRSGSNTGSNRVIRGGSWSNDARNLRSANRNNDGPGDRWNNVGFRLVSSRPTAGCLASTDARPAPRT
ncbi:MAG: SUMF1/EgtB/PvdO family nonheme iron enzyme [Elusimicrobia bacterium]|nr:SUMF1/EgtB/PvdO family nonheme iron enzyme [Elusimicrobiota bacterium]